MATFLMHPLFGASAAYVVSRGRTVPGQFVVLSAICQWLPDLDTLTYLFGIDEQHPLGHRGAMHSIACASVVALLVMRYIYGASQPASSRWWAMYGWFFLMTASHGLFDAMVEEAPGVAFFWPVDTTRYLLPWRPLLSVPMAMSALNGPLWHAVWVECWFFGVLLSGLFVLTQRLFAPHVRPSAQVSTRMELLQGPRFFKRL
jgi:inner membrane protein